MRKENSDFNTKFISEAGSYLVNADYFAFVELKDYACYVIADGIDLDEKKESAKLAVVLGTEGDGLPASTIAGCDFCVRIPMAHGVDSLNVAAASAVAFWELGKRA